MIFLPLKGNAPEFVDLQSLPLLLYSRFTAQDYYICILNQETSIIHDETSKIRIKEYF